MVKASEIVEACRELLGSYYRWWYVGASLPMWLDDGYQHPPKDHILPPGVGVMCADFLDWGRQECGLPPYGGTTGYADNLVNVQPFDVNVPGIAGAVAIKPYYSPYSQGHVALYTGDSGGHQLIQSLVNPGVTQDFSDYETVQWPGCEFDFYGLMPDVDYSDELGESPAEPEQQIESVNWFGIGEDNIIRLGGDWSKGWIGERVDRSLVRVYETPSSGGE